MNTEDEQIEEELRLIRADLQNRLDAATCPGCREVIQTALECVEGDTADECIEQERADVWDEMETEVVFRIHKNPATCARCRAEIEEMLGGVPVHEREPGEEG